MILTRHAPVASLGGEDHRRRFPLLATLATLLLTTIFSAATAEVTPEESPATESPAKESPPPKPTAIVNARIVTMDGAVIDDGTLLMEGDKITAVGSGIELPKDTEKFDAQGATITPGLIDIDSSLAVEGSASPDCGIEDAFDHYDTLNLSETLRHGVTAVHVLPRPSGGTSAVMRLVPLDEDGQSFGEILGSRTALCMDFGSGGSALGRLRMAKSLAARFRGALKYRESLEKYDKDLAKYKEELKKQKSEDSKKEEGDEKNKDAKDKPDDEKGEDKKKDPDKKNGDEKKDDKDGLKKPQRPRRSPSSEVMLMAVDREIPVWLTIHRNEDILNFLEGVQEEFSLDLVLLGAAEAHLVAEQISDAGAKVVLGNMTRGGSRRINPARTTARRLLTTPEERTEPADEDKESESQDKEAESPDDNQSLESDEPLDEPLDKAIVFLSRSRQGRPAPSRGDIYRRTVPNQGAILQEAGVPWLVGSGGLDGGSRFVLQNAQIAIANNGQGNALKLVTAKAADLLGVEDKLGRLRPGLLADVVIWSGDPLEPASRVKRVYMGGTVVYQADTEEAK